MGGLKFGASAAAGLVAAGGIYAGIWYIRTHPTMPWTPYPAMVEVSAIETIEEVFAEPAPPLTPAIQPHTVKAKTLKKLPD